MHASSPTELIGRTQALATLATELDAARAGRGRFVSIVGDGGIGKTLLIEEFVNRSDIPAGRALWGANKAQAIYPLQFDGPDARSRLSRRPDVRRP